MRFLGTLDMIVLLLLDKDRKKLLPFRIMLVLGTLALSLPILGHIQSQGAAIQLQSHGPILIVNDSSFTSANGVTRGNGTISNPFVVKDLSITALGGTGIEIRNTTAYFTIQNVLVSSSQYGILLYNATNGEVSNSTLLQNQYGMLLVLSKSTDVFSNNFVNNANQANDTSGSNNHWDNGYTIGGNFWSDYAGMDRCSGVNQNMCPDPDGIGDRPYNILGNSTRRDFYPLVRAYNQDNTPPVWPPGSKLIPSRVMATSLTLNWTKATDDNGVIRYRIFEEKIQITNVTANILSYNVTGLNPGTSYTFKIEAGDRANNWSNDGPSLTIPSPGSPPWFLTLDYWIRNWYIPLAAATIVIVLVSTVMMRRRTSLQNTRGARPITKQPQHHTMRAT